MKLFKDSIGIRNRNERPFGQIPLEGKCSELIERAKEIIQDIVKEQGIVGITIGGGLSRGYGDDLSEIDINIYLEDETYQNWILGMSPFPYGDSL